MRTVSAGILTLLCAALGGAALAQGATGTLSGKLIDPFDNVVGNIETAVTVKNTVSGQTFSARIMPSGEYRLTGLPAGTYDVNLPIPCCMYTRLEQKGVTVAAGQSLKLDLHVGFGMNLGTIGDDPGALGVDMRARTKNVAGKTPRTPDGKVDFTGIWVNVLEGANGFGGRIPMKPWAAEMNRQLQQINTQHAGVYCLPQSAIPTTLPFPYKFIQTPKEIVQIEEFITPGHRQIFMDGRKHPPADEWNPAWMGHSIGRWEGDTLVIDTVGFNEITPGFGVHSEKLHVIERMRRPTYGTLEIELTAEDPDAWDGPYKQTIKAGLADGEEIQEWVCAENNKDPMYNNGGRAWKGRP